VSVERWAELDQRRLAALRDGGTIVVVPLGATEQHGLHLPVGTDTFLAEAVSEEAARRSTTSVVLTPPLWLGLSPHHMDFPGTLTLSTDLWMGVVRALCSSLAEQGMQRILLVNGHGGNAAAAVAAAHEAGHALAGRARVAAVTYFQLLQERQHDVRRSRSGGTGHAGEFETSLMLAVRPALVDMAAARPTYPEGTTPHLRTDLFEPSSVATYRSFASLSPTGTLGDPTLATPDAGRRALDIAADALAAVIEEMAGWPIGAGPTAPNRSPTSD